MTPYELGYAVAMEKKAELEEFLDKYVPYLLPLLGAGAGAVGGLGMHGLDRLIFRGPTGAPEEEVRENLIQHLMSGAGVGTGLGIMSLLRAAPWAG